MIPKIIHYCWFGGADMPDLNKKCIESWHRLCPDFEIVRHDDENTRIDTSIDYVATMARLKKYAFLTDYLRLAIIKEFGGVYLDVDVELIKPISGLLGGYDAFFCFQKQTRRRYNEFIGTGLGFGCAKGHAVVDMLMQMYTRRLIMPCGGFTAPKRESIVFNRIGVKLNNEFQVIDRYNMAVYPSEYMCPMDWRRKNFEISPNTVGIHHYTNLWK